MAGALLLLPLLGVLSSGPVTAPAAGVREAHLRVAPLVAAPPVELVKKRAPPAEEPEEAAETGTPDGCWFKYLCYAPPSGQGVHPAIEDSKWTMLLTNDVLVFLLPSFVPFPSVVAYLLSRFFILDSADRAPLGGDLLLGIVLGELMLYGLLAVSGVVLLFTWWLVLPIVVAGILVAIYEYWLRPVTMIHLENAAMNARAAEDDTQEEDAAPRKKKGKRGKKALPPGLEDDETVAPAPAPAPAPSTGGAKEPAPVKPAEPDDTGPIVPQ